MTWVALRSGPTLPAVLGPSDAGEPLYRKMGFRDFHRFRVWRQADAVAAGRSSPPIGERFVAIRSGPAHACALRLDGSPVCWATTATLRHRLWRASDSSPLAVATPIPVVSGRTARLSAGVGETSAKPLHRHNMPLAVPRNVFRPHNNIASSMVVLSTVYPDPPTRTHNSAAAVARQRAARAHYGIVARGV